MIAKPFGKSRENKLEIFSLFILTLLSSMRNNTEVVGEESILYTIITIFGVAVFCVSMAIPRIICVWISNQFRSGLNRIRARFEKKRGKGIKLM